MTAPTTFKRKSVSLDADVVARLEGQAKSEGRSLSNLVNFRLRGLMAATRSSAAPTSQSGRALMSTRRQAKKKARAA